MGRGKGHIPIRTCISCREKKDKRELSRLVVDERNRLIVDKRQILSGRGAYVCNRDECKNRLFKIKRLNKIFRKEGPIYIGSDIWKS